VTATCATGLAQLGELIEGTDRLSATRGAQLRGRVSATAGWPGSRDPPPVGVAHRHHSRRGRGPTNGNYLLCSSEPHLSTEDIFNSLKGGRWTSIRRRPWSPWPMPVGRQPGS
jgi:hypothetical protein